MPLVSIIVPTYNCVHFLPLSLNSALKQSLKDFEIIVVDDGSTDNTKEVISQISDRQPGKLRYIYQNNQGLPYARNTGLKASQGKYVALLDSDDLWLKDRLTTQIEFLADNPDYSFAFSNVFAVDMSDNLGKTMMRLKNPVSGNIFYNLLCQNFISVPTMIFRIDCIETIGYYSTEFRLCEDHQFNLRLANYYKGKYINKPLACYRIRRDSLSSSLIEMCKWDLRVIDSIEKIFPKRLAEGKKYFNKARANLYFELGYKKYRMNEFKEALLCFVKCLRFDNFNYNAAKLIIVLSSAPHSLLKKRNLTVPQDEAGLFA